MLYTRFAVGYGHHDSLVYLALSLLYLLYSGPCHALYAVCLALECRHGFLEGAFLEVGVSVVLEFVFGERTFHSQHFDGTARGILHSHWSL